MKRGELHGKVCEGRQWFDRFRVAQHITPTPDTAPISACVSVTAVASAHRMVRNMNLTRQSY